MQVVILCGGLGTRLREETEFRPKPMVNIGNRPILWHIMKIYACHGITDFTLALGYKGEMIKDYFFNYEMMNNDVTIELGKQNAIYVHQAHDEVGWRVTLSDTGAETLKGARLKKIERYIHEDNFMVTYGDGIGNINLKALLKFHASHGKIGTVTGVNPASRFGELKVKGDNVEAFFEKPTGGGNSFINGGFFVFKKEIFNYLTDDDNCDLEYGPLEQLASNGELMMYKHKGFWACMDTIRDMEYLNKLWRNGNATWRIW